MSTPTWDETKPAGAAAPTWESTQAKTPSLMDSLSQGSGSQQSGPVISPKGLINKLTPTKEQLPELIGGTIGGIAGGGNPLAVVGGGALGSAAGEAYKQLGQRFGFLKGQAPQTSKEAAMGVGGAGLRGAAAQTVGLGVSKVLAPFAGSITPEVKAGLEAAKRVGVNPPLSTMTESPAVQGMERISEYGPFGAPITAQRQQAVKQLETFADKISQGLGQDKSPEFVADKVNAQTKAFEQAFKKTKDALYDPINKELGSKPINPENTINAIQDVLDQKAGGKEGQGLLKDWLERLRPGYKVPGMVIEQDLPLFSTLKAIRTEAGSRGSYTDPGVTGIKSQLEGIYAAASQDMDQFAEKNGMSDALKKANETYATGIRKLQGSLIDNLQNNAKDPSKLNNLYTLVFRKDNPPLVKAAKEMLGDEAFGNLRKQWFDNMIKDSTRNIEGTDIISPSLLAKNLSKVGDSMSEITADNPELAQKMADLTETAKLLTRGLKVNSGSQTGFINKINSVVGMITAPLIRSNLGKEYLTRGFPTLGKVAGTTTQAGTQVGLQKIGDYVNQKK